LDNSGKTPGFQGSDEEADAGAENKHLAENNKVITIAYSGENPHHKGMDDRVPIVESESFHLPPLGFIISRHVHWVIDIKKNQQKKKAESRRADNSFWFKFLFYRIAGKIKFVSLCAQTL
jgi:hypothetical protein